MKVSNFRGEEKIFCNVIEYIIYSIALKSPYKFLLFYIFLISRLGLDRVILVFDTVIHTNKGVFDLY